MKYRPPSKLAERTHKALQTLGFAIEPEYKIGGRLRVDFVVKALMAAIEVDGVQHDSFSAHFHGDKDGFRDSKKRDNHKQVLCEEEGLRFIRLSAKEIIAAGSPEALAKVILEKLNAYTKEDEW